MKIILGDNFKSQEIKLIPILFLPKMSILHTFKLRIRQGDYMGSFTLHPLTFEKEIILGKIPKVNKGLLDYDCTFEFKPHTFISD